GLRVAWTPDLGGAAPMDPALAATAGTAARKLSGLGWTVEDAAPEIGAILEPFLALNAILRQAAVGQYLDESREQMDPVLVKRRGPGRQLGAAAAARAELARTAHHQSLHRFFARYDLLLTPTTATAALPLGAPVPTAIAGRPIGQPVDMLIPTLAFNFSG